MLSLFALLPVPWYAESARKFEMKSRWLASFLLLGFVVTPSKYLHSLMTATTNWIQWNTQGIKSATAMRRGNFRLGKDKQSDYILFHAFGKCFWSRCWLIPLRLVNTSFLLPRSAIDHWQITLCASVIPCRVMLPRREAMGGGSYGQWSINTDYLKIQHLWMSRDR